MHEKAIAYENKSALTLQKFYATTPLGRVGAAQTDIKRMLIDLVYLLAKTEKPLAMFTDIVALEKRHGVGQLRGDRYLNHIKMATQFAGCIAQVNK